MERNFCMTAFLKEQVARSEDMAKAVTSAVQRFNSGDWGKVPEAEKEANNADLKARYGRVFARYDSPMGEICIKLEFYSDEETAIIMFASEY